MKLKYMNSPKLRERSKRIPKITKDISKLSRKMSKFMSQNSGIGLAAPQIGRNIRLIVIAKPGLTKRSVHVSRKPLVYINPAIIHKSDETETMDEACLSCPGISVNIERPSDITFEAWDLDGEYLHIDASGLFARCVQHEIDHLDGILIIDHEEKES